MNFNINDFSGPLDVLLHMVKKHEVDIYKIDLKIIIDEYIEFINSLPKEDLDSKSEYLIMASELIHLKSKLLLGFDEEEKDEEYEINSEEELRERLIEFEKYQNISNDFRKLESNRMDYYTKVPESLKDYAPEADLKDQMDIAELLNAFLNIKKREEYHKPLSTKVTMKEYSVKDKTKYIRDKIKGKDKIDFEDLFVTYSNEEIVVTLLSVLEMTKDHEIYLSQKENFSKIYVEVRHE